MSELNKDFLRWEVKPVWWVRFPSELSGGQDQKSFQIYGVDRGGLDIVRNWAKINSVEQFGQGWVAKPSDMTFTIAIKEHGDSFEKMRRLDIGGVMFDVELELLRETTGVEIGDRPEEHIEDVNYVPWLNGFEKYKGCVVNRMGQTVELAEFPVREFECVFLRRTIKEAFNSYNTTELEEGNGTYPSLDELSI